VAREAGDSSYGWAVDDAHAAGVEDWEIVAVAPLVGVAGSTLRRHVQPRGGSFTLYG
jgi:hypothetical protein